MIELIVLIAVVALVLAAGIRLGMLVAPRLDRWTEPHDEEPRDDGPG